jgi:hypothetical protein
MVWSDEHTMQSSDGARSIESGGAGRANDRFYSAAGVTLHRRKQSLGPKLDIHRA